MICSGLDTDTETLLELTGKADSCCIATSPLYVIGC